MIEDPPLITLRRKVPRPSKAQLAALAGTPTGFIVDALDGRGALPPEVKPVVPEFASFCGVALPCGVGPSDNLAVLAALPLVQAGDVVIASVEGFRDAAVVGDLLLGMLRNRGAVAFVTDGTVRDLPGLRDARLPCFATGTTPNSPVRNGPGTVNLPIAIGGVVIGPGDILIGDQDGVVVLPFDRIDAVIARLVDIRAAEKELLAKVEGGLGVPPWIEELYRSGKVREL
jgi:4-hydroxy-4-methyl-2-oxoglutarate aldolase